MAAAVYEKGKWKTEIDADELASGKYQGIVRLYHEGGSYKEQIVHRTTDVFDTPDGAVAEATILAQHILEDL